MIQETKSKFQELRSKFQLKRPWNNIVIFVLNILIAIPVFIIIHQNIIDPQWPFQIDRVLLAIAILAVIQLFLRALRTIMIICMGIYIIVLLYGSTIGNYGFNDVFEDYRSMMYLMLDDANPQDLIISKLLPFPNKSKILNAIDYKNPKVRNYAVMATAENFRDVKGYNEYRNIIQCFGVFKKVKENWNYVDDPKGQEYIAAASETVHHLSGDCDDHAIFMAACIRAVGGTPRLIHTGGHIYPEMLIGTKKDLEAINYLIKEVLFVRESKGKEIHYHIDERGQIWLNLDYTARYPGGPFMSEEILGALTLN